MVDFASRRFSRVEFLPQKEIISEVHKPLFSQRVKQAITFSIDLTPTNMLGLKIGTSNL